MLARGAHLPTPLAVALPTTHSPQAISWFITPSQPAKVLWVVTKEDAMRSIVIGALVAAGLSLVTTVPAISAPANVAAVGQAAAEMGSVTQARCWCTWRGWRGYCRRWRCW